MKFFCHTLGCKSNFYETASLTSLLEQHGFSETDSMESADIILINSCTVTAQSDKKTRSALNRARRVNPGSTVILTGCYVQANPSEAAGLEKADIIAGISEMSDLPDILKLYLINPERSVEISPFQNGEPFRYVPVKSLKEHTRAFLKVEDGCDRFCGYCAVPYARGPVRSLDPGKINLQAKLFAENGYKEVVLTGINLSLYGKESGFDLCDAVRAANVAGIERIRLSSLEPDLLSDELLKKLSDCRKLCGHFHLSLQSGCERTLAAMNRRYSVSDYLNTAERIKELFGNGVTFTTDVMVGFPSETDGDFYESLRFVEDFGFLKCHVFRYSPRPNTAAASLIPLESSIVTARAKHMTSAADGVRKRILAGQTGKTVRVIAEQQRATGEYEGFSDDYIPVVVSGGRIETGDMVTATVTGVKGDYCTADAITCDL